MPLLPLPVGPTQLGGGDLPVSDETDVLAIFPDFSQTSDPAPVRDGLIAALTAMLITAQERFGLGAALSDILYSVGSSLDGILNERGCFRQKSESDGAYRARGLALPSLVTPTAILAAVNAILGPYSTVKAQYFESVQDRWFLRKGNPSPTSFHSFLYKRLAANPSSPFYPDRLYEQDAALNAGRFRPQSNPGGARMFGDSIGRLFVVRVPDISGADGGILAVYGNTAGHGVPSSRPLGMHLYKTSSAGSTYGAYLRKKSATALDIYKAIVSTVERIKGASIRWRLQIDRTLS